MIAFEKMRVSVRLIVAGAAVLVGLTFLSGYTLFQIKRDALAAHSQRIKNIVEVAKGIVGNYQKLEADKVLTRAEAQEKAKEALRTPRFEGTDYYFLYDFTGKALMIPGSKLEGQNLMERKDINGFQFAKAFVENGKAGAGYITYHFPRIGQDQTQAVPKLGYVAGIPEWEWIIGTGVYIDDVDATVKKAALSYGLISLVILAAVSAIAFLVSRSIVNQLGGEPTTAIDLMSRAAAGDLTVEVNSTSRGSILDSAGQMVRSIRQMVTEITQSQGCGTNQYSISRGFHCLSKAIRCHVVDGRSH